MKRALLVNDSRFESLILKDLLDEIGYEVELADEFDALLEAEIFNPDLVIVNYIMRETSGDKLIQLLKEGKPEAICLLSTSNIVSKDTFKGSKIDEILRTPVSMFTLKDILRRVEEVNANKLEEKMAKEIENTQEERYCRQCNAMIGDFGNHIVFCPYCGEEI